MKPLLILGAGGFAREAYQWATDAGFTVKGFWNPEADHKYLLNGVRVRDDLKVFDRECKFLCAVGDPKIRIMLANKARRFGYEPCEPIIHPTAKIALSAEIGPGTIVCPGSIISDSVKVGFHVLINLNVTVGHDCFIANYVTISPGVNVSGNVTVGPQAYLGTGSCIRERLMIGPEAIVGMGAVVIKSVDESQTVVGNPAKPKEIK